MCLEISELDPAKFISAPKLVQQVALKKTEVELDLSNDIDIILMVEKGFRGEISDSIHNYAKANNKYMKDVDKNKEPSYLNYWDVNYLYGWAMPQTFPTFNFKSVEDTSQFNEDFIKSYNKKSDGTLS